MKKNLQLNTELLVHLSYYCVDLNGVALSSCCFGELVVDSLDTKDVIVLFCIVINVA